MYVSGHLQATFNSYHCRSYLCQSLLGSDTGKYAPDDPSDAHPNSRGSSSGGTYCNAACQMQA